MSTIPINRFDGGLAEDVRTFATNQSSYELLSHCGNFDTFSNPHLLRPFSDPVAESTGATITDNDITDVIACDIGGTTKLIGWGRESAASAKATFFTKTAPISSNWVSVISSSGSAPTPGTLVEFRGSAYAIDATANLVKFTSGTTYTAIATIGAALTQTAKPFVHPEDNILYMSGGSGFPYRISSYDASSLTVNAFTLPANMTITSFTNYGGYLAPACKPTSGVGRSIVYLWDRDTSKTTVQESIDWGDGALEVLENLDGELVGISQIKLAGTFDTITNYRYIIKVYSGGFPRTIKDFTVTNTNLLRHWKAKQGNKLYFGFDNDSTVHVVGKNKQGEWFVARDRYITPAGGTIVGTLDGISIVGDILFTSYTDGGVGSYLARTSDSTFALTSTYTTTINPNMPTIERYKNKSLKAIQVAYKVASASGTIIVRYASEDESGTLLSTFNTIASESKSASGDYVTPPGGAVNFQTGREFQFKVLTTGDTRIKEIRYIYETLNDI